MNTLGKAITRQFFHNEAGFDLLQNDWRNNWRQGKEGLDKLQPVHFFLYQALRGKDWKKAFTPITNTNKIENGYHPIYKVRDILRTLRFVVTSKNIESYNSMIEPLGPEVTWESVKLLLKYLPEERDLLVGPSYINHGGGKIEDQAA